MREAREYEAASVGEAVRAASEELGVGEEDLVYEVRDAGSRGILGMGARPTRIVVIVGECEEPCAPRREGGGGFVDEEIGAFQETLLRKMRLDLKVEVERTEGYVYVRMSGEDRDVVLQSRAELLEAFQYILNRSFARRLDGARVLADCDGFRKRKEEELRQIAKRVSDRVKLTGLSEQLGWMNPYERRIVHLAVAAEEGVSSESHGEGFMKRVAILPAG